MINDSACVFAIGETKYCQASEVEDVEDVEDVGVGESRQHLT